MELVLDPRLVLGFAFAFIATPWMARLALHLKWADDPRAPGIDARERARKLQGRAVPTVGGWVLLVGGLAFLLGRSSGGGAVVPASEGAFGAGGWIATFTPGPGVLCAVLLGAFLVGWLDDRRGLSAGRKLAGQLLALAPLFAAPLLGLSSWPVACALTLLGLVAFNVLNTFDNADGALGTLGAAGFLLAVPQAAVSLLGFVPWNLDARRRGGGGPTAYLGDAGAFVAGALVLATPYAWGLLWIPALDLARLFLLRWREGRAPWVGDRRHLAHRLAGRGLAPLGVAGLQLGAALPALVGWLLSLRTAEPGLALGYATAGLALGAGLFAGLLAWAPDPRACPRASACE